MINNISHVDTGLPLNVTKATTSRFSVATPPILSFKTPFLKQKATLRVKKFKRSDNIIIAGSIDDDYVDIEEQVLSHENDDKRNFFSTTPPPLLKEKILKECYVIDYIQSPHVRCGLGTEAIKGLAEKAMFDPRIQGRIVTFSAPMCRESSPALFFYKLGFRFIDNVGNEYMEECIKKKIPDIPPQTGMMYLPRTHLHKLLRYGDLF